jgi:hypothetical protein
MKTTTNLSTELLAYYRQISTEIFTVADQNVGDRCTIICLCSEAYPAWNRRPFYGTQ